MAKFITLTNKSDRSLVDINMDRIESFRTAKDEQGGTKLYTEETDKTEQFWRVEETPVQIRAMLKIAGTVNSRGPDNPLHPCSPNADIRKLSPTDWAKYVDNVFTKNCRAKPGNYDVSPGDALVIARILQGTVPWTERANHLSGGMAIVGERPWPMRHVFEGIEVSEQEIIDALRMARNSKEG